MMMMMMMMMMMGDWQWRPPRLISSVAGLLRYGSTPAARARQNRGAAAVMIATQ